VPINNIHMVKVLAGARSNQERAVRVPINNIHMVKVLADHGLSSVERCMRLSTCVFAC